MNERIDQLYKEAEKAVLFLSNSEESKKKIIQRKFAELIVRECADIADEYRDEHLRTLPSDRIKKHFGVEF